MGASRGLRVNVDALAMILKITSTSNEEHEIEDIHGGNGELMLLIVKARCWSANDADADDGAECVRGCLVDQLMMVNQRQDLLTESACTSTSRCTQIQQKAFGNSSLLKCTMTTWEFCDSVFKNLFC